MKTLKGKSVKTQRQAIKDEIEGLKNEVANRQEILAGTKLNRTRPNNKFAPPLFEQLKFITLNLADLKEEIKELEEKSGDKKDIRESTRLLAIQQARIAVMEIEDRFDFLDDQKKRCDKALAEHPIRIAELEKQL